MITLEEELKKMEAFLTNELPKFSAACKGAETRDPFKPKRVKKAAPMKEGLKHFKVTKKGNA